jgi:hypothetical protein
MTENRLGRFAGFAGFAGWPVGRLPVLPVGRLPVLPVVRFCRLAGFAGCPVLPVGRFCRLAGCRLGITLSHYHMKRVFVNE